MYLKQKIPNLYIFSKSELADKNKLKLYYILGKQNGFTSFFPVFVSILKVPKTLSDLENKFKSLQNQDNMSIYDAFVNTRENNLYRVDGCVSKIATNTGK